MKKRFGFTLAEVLITLGIVGVVAALTAPALVKNSSQAKVGPSLAKFVNTWENAADALLADEDANFLKDATTNDATEWSISTVLMDSMGKYAPIIPFQENETYTYDGVTITMGPNLSSLYKLGDNVIINYTPGVRYDTHTNIREKGIYNEIVSTLLVDIDAFGGKNKTGVDVFCFYLDNTGRLIPYGGATHRYLSSSNIPRCDHSGDVEARLACTGEIADNGWKVKTKK